jgi:drug/metabolite transporter (DMT)-like permease
MCLHPVFGAILGMIFFNEVLRSYHIVGTLLVLIGIFLVSRAMAAAQSVKS